MGTVYSYSVVRLNRHPAFAELGPYAVAYVDLDEGFRFMCNVLHCDPAMVRIGMPVRVCFESRAGGEQKLPQVEPA